MIEDLKTKLSNIKAKAKELKAKLISNDSQIAELKRDNVSICKELSELNSAIYDLEDLKNKSLFLLVKHTDYVDLTEVGTRRDGSTWVVWLEQYDSVEEAKMKLAIEGKEARLLKDDWYKRAMNYRIGIGIFSYEELSTVASDPL